MGMPHLFEDGDLPVDAVNVRLVLDLVLFENFDGHFIAGYNVSSLLNFAKGSFALGFADDEATDLLALTILLLLRVLFLISEQWRWSPLVFLSGAVSSSRWHLFLIVLIVVLHVRHFLQII